MRMQGQDSIQWALKAVLLILCAQTRADAQEKEWERLNDEALSLYGQGRYDSALVAAKRALQLAEQALGPGHPDVASSLNNIAMVYQTQGHYAQAEPIYQRALAIREKTYGLDHPAVRGLRGRQSYLFAEDR